MTTVLRDPSASSSPIAATVPRTPGYAWRPLSVVVAVKLLISAAVSARYGWHRDELYYAATARHLALGFVDFPPVTPLLAAVGRVAFADSLVGLRLLASLAGAGVILVTAALCRDLGGGRRAQVLAAVGITPLVLGSNSMFQTVSFDQLTWALLLWATARLLLVPSGRGWILVAAAAALAWQTKFTVAVLFAALLVGFLATRAGRAAVRPRAVAMGGLLFVVVALPNLWWQVGHDWASLEFLTGRGDQVRDENPPIRFVLELLVITGLLTLPVAIRGVRHLWRDPRLRPLGGACALVPPLGLALGGKGYYVAPIAVACLSAGAASLDVAGHTWTRFQVALPVLVVAGALVTSPTIIPILPADTAVSTGVAELRDDWVNEMGWPELAADVADAWRSLPQADRHDTVVVAANYGVAGALERFGPARGLRAAVVSGHLTHAYWPIPDEARDARHVLAVGFAGRTAPRWCGGARSVGRVVGLADVETEERGTPIWACHLAEPLGDLRSELARNR